MDESTSAILILVLILVGIIVLTWYGLRLMGWLFVQFMVQVDPDHSKFKNYRIVAFIVITIYLITNFAGERLGGWVDSYLMS